MDVWVASPLIPFESCILATPLNDGLPRRAFDWLGLALHVIVGEAVAVFVWRQFFKTWSLLMSYYRREAFSCPSCDYSWGKNVLMDGTSVSCPNCGQIAYKPKLMTPDGARQAQADIDRANWNMWDNSTIPQKIAIVGAMIGTFVLLMILLLNVI